MPGTVMQTLAEMLSIGCPPDPKVCQQKRPIKHQANAIPHERQASSQLLVVNEVKYIFNLILILKIYVQ